jgi:hypothetical protein
LDGKVRGRHWNIIVDDKNIQLKGLSCDKCHKPINPQHKDARWVSLNPRSKNKGRLYEGFHIPQVISPDCKWGTVIQDYNTKRRGVFFNETLGLSYDSSDKPLSRNELIKVCSPKLSMDEKFLDEEIWPKIGNGQQGPIFAGIDWGGGSEASKTVLTLGTYFIDKAERREHFTNFFWKRFEGEEAEGDEQLKAIKRILHKWRVRIIGVDYGGGLHPNAELKKEFGAARIMTYQYANPKTKLMWQGRLMRTIVHRSEVITDIITAIKSGFFVFPNWTQFEVPFGRDMLSVHSELDSRGVIKYQKEKSSATDDSLHALVYSFLASLQVRPNIAILNPGLQSKYYSVEDY